MGDAFYYLVFAFMVDRMTKNPVTVSWMLAIQATPYIFFSPFSGALADRVDRRVILVLSDAVSSVILVGIGVALGLGFQISVPLLFILAFLLNTANCFAAPAKNAAVPRLVPEEDLLAANSLGAATQSMMPLIGLVLSTFILGLLERTAPGSFFAIAVLLNAASFVVSGLFMVRLPSIIPDRSPEPTHFLDDLRGGFRFTMGNELVRVVLLLGIGLTFFIGPFFPVYMTTNREWFGGSFLTLGVIEASFFGAMVIGSIWIGKQKVTKPGVAFCHAIVLCGVFVAAMGLSRIYWLFVFWNAACGIVLPYAQVPINTHLQTIIPDEFRGRVNSVSTMASQGIQPLALALGGFLVARIGLQPMYIVMGVGFGIVGVLGYVSKPLMQTRSDG